MEDTNKLGEVFYNDETVDLKKTPIIELEKIIEELNNENKSIKNSIISILEDF